MQGSKIIGTTMLLSILAAIIGERRAGKTMPRPRAIAAILGMYGILGLVAELGREAERIAGAIAVTLLIATIFVGAAGNTIIDFLNTLSTWVAGGPPAAGGPAPTLNPGGVGHSPPPPPPRGRASSLAGTFQRAAALRPARP